MGEDNNNTAKIGGGKKFTEESEGEQHSSCPDGKFGSSVLSSYDEPSSLLEEEGSFD